MAPALTIPYILTSMVTMVILTTVVTVVTMATVLALYYIVCKECFEVRLLLIALSGIV